MRGNHKHGMTGTPEYGVWLTMRRRCDTPSVERYPEYGGRGISVCDRWHKFENFIADMGRRPSLQHSIERRNNDGNYEPSNCHWATRDEQVYNKRNNRLLDYKGAKINTKQATEIAGIPKNIIFRRLYAGWSDQDAIERPMRRW
jgi:hypothetical protein